MSSEKKKSLNFANGLGLFVVGSYVAPIIYF